MQALPLMLLYFVLAYFYRLGYETFLLVEGGLAYIRMTSRLHPVNIPLTSRLHAMASRTGAGAWGALCRVSSVGGRLYSRIGSRASRLFAQPGSLIHRTFTQRVSRRNPGAAALLPWLPGRLLP